MKSTLQKQSYLVIALVLTVAVGYPLFAFLPRMKAISNVRQEIRQKQEYVAATEKLRPQLALQEEAVRFTEDYARQQRSTLVAPDKLSQVFRSISGLVHQSGATTTRFEPLEPEAFDTFRKARVTLGVAGTTEALHRFIARLEGQPTRIWLERLQFAAPRESGQPTELTAELAIFVDNPEISN